MGTTHLKFTFSLIGLFAFFTLVLSCETSENEMTEEEQEMNSESNPLDAPPDNVFIVNMNAASMGDRVAILGCNRLPIQSDLIIRDSLHLDNELFFGIYGANYNEDGSVPLGLNDFGGPLSGNQGRNKMSITFILKDDETANASMTIGDSYSIEPMGTPVSCGYSSQRVGSLDCVFRVLESGSDVLGGFETVTYNAEDLSAVFQDIVGNLFYGISDADEDRFDEYISAIKVQDTLLKIRVVETVRVEDGEFTIHRPQ